MANYQKTIDYYRKENRHLNETIARLSEENGKLKQIVEPRLPFLDIEKEEKDAIRMFAQDIHTEIARLLKNNIRAKRRYQNRLNIIEDEAVMYINGKIHILGDIDRYIKKLVTEMESD